MNKSPVKRLLAPLAFLLLSGCGTLYNLDEGQGRIYGGVRTDLAFTGLCALGVAQDAQGPWVQAYLFALGAASLVLDAPLSAAGDTLTLPLTYMATYRRLNAACDGCKENRPPSDKRRDLETPSPAKGDSPEETDRHRSETRPAPPEAR